MTTALRWTGRRPTPTLDEQASRLHSRYIVAVFILGFSALHSMSSFGLPIDFGIVEREQTDGGQLSRPPRFDSGSM